MMASNARIVLVLDGHTTQALAAVRSLGRAGYRVLVASHHRAPLGGWSKYCEAVHRLEGETPTAFAAMRAWAISRGVWLAMPMTERSCVLCNIDRDAWQDAGVIVGCAPTEILLRAFDKAKTARYAEIAGVRIPETRAPSSFTECMDAAVAIGFPCIIKPRFSSAWNGWTFLTDSAPHYAENESMLAAAVMNCRQGDRWPVIQRLVPGQGKGAFALFDHGEPLVWFAHERLRDVRPSGAGSSLRRSAPLDPRLVAPAERLLRAMRWHGPAMVEFRDDGVSEPCLIEVNGRFWGSLQLAIAAGVDFPRLWVDLLRGVSPPPVAPYARGVTVRWLWGDVKRFVTIVSGRPEGYAGSFPTIAEGLRELFGPQPVGTRLETWEPDDRWPAAGELVQGVADLASRVARRIRSRRKTRGTPRRSLFPASEAGGSVTTREPETAYPTAHTADVRLAVTQHSNDH